MPSNVLSLHLKQTFPPIIWIFTEGEGDGIEYRLSFKIFSTLLMIAPSDFLTIRRLCSSAPGLACVPPCPHTMYCYITCSSSCHHWPIISPNKRFSHSTHITARCFLLPTFALGVIQLLRGPNFTQFWPPTPSSGQLWIFCILPDLWLPDHVLVFYWLPTYLILST